MDATGEWRDSPNLHAHPLIVPSVSSTRISNPTNLSSCSKPSLVKVCGRHVQIFEPLCVSSLKIASMYYTARDTCLGDGPRKNAIKKKTRVCIPAQLSSQGCYHYTTGISSIGQLKDSFAT